MTSSTHLPPSPTPPLLRFELYVAGDGADTVACVAHIRQLLDEVAFGEYTLETIDVAEHPRRAERESIPVTPTLLMRLVSQTRRVYGDPKNVRQIRWLIGRAQLGASIEAGADAAPLFVSAPRPPIETTLSGDAEGDRQAESAQGSGDLGRARAEIERLEGACQHLDSRLRESDALAFRFAESARSPLASIHALLELLRDEKPRRHTPDMADKLQSACDDADALEQLLEAMLADVRANAAPTGVL